MRAAVVVVALVLAAPALAKGPRGLDRAKIPPGGPTPPLVLPRPLHARLASGAQLLVVERHGLPMAAVAVVWPRGAGDEPLADAGLSGLCAALLDQGTAKHRAPELADAVDRLGAQLQSGSGWDSTAVTLQTLTRHLDASLALLGEVLATPTFDAKELERVRAERITALVEQRDAATGVAAEVFGRVLFGERRYGRPVLGTEASLKRFSRDDVMRWQRERLRPSAATVIVVGDVDAKTIAATLDRALAEWKEPTAPPNVATAATAAPLPAPRHVLVDKPGSPQSEVRLGMPGAPRLSPDWYALTVMNEILGGGEFANRLNMSLREEHAFAYGAGSTFAFRRDGGPFVAWSAVRSDATAESLGVFLSELMRIRAVPVQPDELRFAKDALVRGMARHFATLGDLATVLADQVVYGLPDDFLPTFAKKIEAITAAEVLRAAAAHLDPAKLSIVVVGDRALVGEAIDALPLGRFETVDAEARPTAATKPPAPAPTAR